MRSHIKIITTLVLMFLIPLISVFVFLNIKMGYSNNSMFLIKQNINYLLVIVSVGILYIGLAYRIIIKTSNEPLDKIVEQLNEIDREGTLRHLRTTNKSNQIENLSSVLNKIIDNVVLKRRENERLKSLMFRDDLTNLYNNIYFFEYFQKRLSENCTQMTLALIDVDRIKMINDISGRQKGNLVLRKIANTISGLLNENEIAFRYSDDKFIVLFENDVSDKSLYTTELVRTKISTSSILQGYSVGFPITVSIGIAAYPQNAVNIKDLIDNAYKALTYAKSNGGNQCKVYSADIETILDEASDEFVRQEMLNNIVYTLFAAIEAKDNYTRQNSEAVTKYVLKVAERLELSDDDKSTLTIGALLHDCGQIAIPNELIYKTNPLSEEERKSLKEHTTIGRNIIRYVANCPEIEKCIYYHHERWDGKGYPEGKSGTDIPVFARLISIADAYHAMLANGVYRDTLTPEEAFAELRKNSGTQFDPQLVEIFIQVVEKDLKECNK